MRIAVNTRHLLADRLEGVGIVTDEVMRRIAHAHVEDQLDYYFDRKFDQRFIHGPNVKGFALPPVTRLPFLTRFWLDYSVRKHVQKRKADVFLSTDGFIPLGMSIPKVSMFHDVAYLRYPEFLPSHMSAFYKKWIPRYMAYTDHIITVSEFSKSEIVSGYNIRPDKISVVYNGITNSYQPISDEKKRETRLKYTSGKPYLLYLGAIHPRKNILTLINGFNQFKAERKTDVQLVIAGRTAWQTEEVTNAITQSPWKQDIKLPGYVATAEAVALVGSAEAMVYPSLYEGFGLPLLEAMACGVAVICSNVSSLPEVAGNAALLFDPHRSDELAQQMIRICNDSHLKNELITLGHVRTKDFSWDKAAAETYAVLERFGKK